MEWWLVIYCIGWGVSAMIDVTYGAQNRADVGAAIMVGAIWPLILLVVIALIFVAVVSGWWEDDRGERW